MRTSVSIAALFFGCVSLVLSGCSDDHLDHPREVATTNQIQLYILAAQAALKDCGSARMTTAKYPDVFLQNPGWENWRGPYWQGKWRSNDYFGNPLVFAVIDAKLKISSAGRDGHLGTADDIVKYVDLK